jgi:hypothetical protein
MKKIFSAHILLLAVGVTIVLTLLLVPFIETSHPPGPGININPCPYSNPQQAMVLCALNYSTGPSMTLINFIRYNQAFDAINWASLGASVIVLFIISYILLRLFLYIKKPQETKNQQLELIVKIIALYILILMLLFLSYIFYVLNVLALPIQDTIQPSDAGGQSPATVIVESAAAQDNPTVS